MKTDKEILDKLGKLVISKCYDQGILLIDQLRNKTNVPSVLEEPTKFIQSLTSEQIDGLKKVIHRTQNNFLFNFLNIFEEHDEEYKFIYREDDKEINLVEISEMLKAEHLIEGGWIHRFSEYADDHEV